MKKNLLFTALAATTLLFATSCQQDEVFVDGNESIVTFEVGTPQMATRAYSDGLSATQLKYAVYDENHERIDRIPETTTTINGSTRVEMQLAAGKTYNVLFWAANENAPYSVDFVNQTMSIDYDAETLSNDERRDAFYCYHKVQVDKANKTETVKLRRPFAQLNIGTKDLDIALADGIDVSKTGVKVSKVYKTLNFVNGEVSNPVENKVFALNTRPAGEDFPLDDDSYKYLAMNYLLVGIDKTVVDVEFSYGADAATAKTRTYTGIPVQANYRTNIYGSLLTQGIDFDVTIEPDYNNPDNNLYCVVVDGVHYDNFAEAVAKAMELNKPVEFIESVNIDADNTITVPFGSTLTLKLNGNSLNGVTDDADKNDDGQITSADNEAMFDVRGVMNVENGAVTLKHNSDNFGWLACTDVFYVAFNGELNIKDAHIENYGGSDMAYAIDLVNAATTRASEAGIHVNVENSTLKSTYIPVRVFNNGAGMNYVSIHNTKLIGVSRAFWVHIYSNKDNGGNGVKDNTLALDIFGNGNTFEAKNPDRIIEFGFDDEINFDANGNLIEKDAIFTVTTAQELQEALDGAAEGKTTTIRFANDITGDVVVTEKEVDGKEANIVIDGRGYKYDGQIKIKGNSDKGASKLNIQNINFETSTEGCEFIWCNDSSNGSQWRYANNVTIDNCTFTATGAAVHSAIGAKFQQCYNITMNNCTTTNMRTLLQAESCQTTIKVEKATIINGKNGISFNNTKEVILTNSTIEAVGDGSYGVRVKGEVAGYSTYIENCNVTAFVPVLVRNMTAADYTITMVGNNTLTTNNAANSYQVVLSNVDYDGTQALVVPTGEYILTGAEGFRVYPRDMNKVRNNEEFKAALEAGLKNIELQEGEYIIPAAAKGKTVNFVGVGNPEDVKVAVTKVGTGGENCDYGLDGSTVTFENLTITTNSSTYIGYARCKGTYKNCIINGTYTLYDNSVFNDCTFNVSGDVYNIWTWGAPTAEFTGCTFNSDGKAMLLYGTVNTNLTMNNCTFNDKGGLTDKKAAIEIGNDYNKSYELIVNNATVNGYEINDKGINTGTTLWANKNSMPKEKLNVVVDGVDVY
ncbi:MAG: hypothetical protein IJE18_07215 [Bacteroidaceae bacterium]|nr:hypothetical protein [Bacteroidaceae bacterium]